MPVQALAALLAKQLPANELEEAAGDGQKALGQTTHEWSVCLLASTWTGSEFGDFWGSDSADLRPFSLSLSLSVSHPLK